MSITTAVSSSEGALLEVKNLRVDLFTETGSLRILDDVSFSIEKGETLGIVGESGCGKSMTALAILGVLPIPIVRVVGGQVLWNGVDLTACTPAEMRQIRGKQISMVLQDPMTNLNPVFTCGEQIAEVVRLHEGASRRQARGRAVEMLDLVGIPAPLQCVDRYPHELSGGMRQRVMIAIALACRPKLLIADEPTSALDVTVQAQILELIDRLKTELDMAALLISHDMGVIAEHSQKVAVMYAGKIIEGGGVDEFFARPEHPYSRGLLNSLPDIDSDDPKPLQPIKGVVPSLANLPTGCSFSTRCDVATDICRREMPVLSSRSATKKVRCWHAGS